MNESLEAKLSHSHAAYRFAISNLPVLDEKTQFPIQTSWGEFSKASQIHSMMIELGWAFFCRYEGCLEAHLKNRGVALSRQKSLLDWLKENEVCVSKNFEAGLSLYRDIRNKLHHEDGAALNGDRTSEIHLMPDHMQNFYELFVWVGNSIEQVAQRNSKANE